MLGQPDQKLAVYNGLDPSVTRFPILGRYKSYIFTLIYSARPVSATRTDLSLYRPKWLIIPL